MDVRTVASRHKSSMSDGRRMQYSLISTIVGVWNHLLNGPNGGDNSHKDSSPILHDISSVGHPLTKVSSILCQGSLAAVLWYWLQLYR